MRPTMKSNIQGKTTVHQGSVGGIIFANRIINELLEYQKKFLYSCNPQDLLPYSQRRIADVLNAGQLSVIDTGWTSRLVSRLSVIMPTGGRMPLKSLLPTKRKNNRNMPLRNSLEKFGCYFRYISLSKGWGKEEARLYGLFLSTYGAAPKCNMVKPPIKT